MESTRDELSMLMDVAREITAAGKKKSSTLVAAQESMKEKLARERDEKADRLSSIDVHHRHICELVALFLNAKVEDVIDAVANTSESMNTMETFLDKGGTMGVVFYLQHYLIKMNASQMHQEAMHSSEVVHKKIQIGDVDKLRIAEMGVAVYKTLDVAVTIKNIGEVINFIQLDNMNDNGNVVAMNYYLMDNLLTKPLLMNSSKEWTELSKTKSGKTKQASFERQYRQFVNFMKKTKVDIESVIIFDEEEEIQSILRENSEDSNRLNRELIRKVECAVRIWNKKIERTLVQYEQLRKEDEFVGPLEEVEYWRNQLARFSSIVNFISSDTCNRLVNFLKLTGSVILKSWKKHCNQVLDVRNQCTDNVRYLYSFDTFCEPLYRCDPLQIPSHIPSLLYAVRMIFTTSRYFNKMSNVTAILTKISNQLVIVCRSYLNCNGKKTVWNQPKQTILTKIRHCLDLYLKYYQCYTHIQEEMEEAGEKTFGCSEMYVFGKLEAFKKRIEEITDVLTTTSTYSILESSRIDGIDEYAIKFKEFFNTISRMKYDVLNHRLPEFDEDYAEYKQKVADTEWLLEEFVGISLSKMQDVDNVLRLLKRFEKLNLPCLHLEERYLEAMIMFQDELGNLRDIYNEERQTPMLPKLMPPVAGRLMWIKNFYRKIEQPMLVFREKSRVIKHRKVQKCIQLYNALSMVFVHYEKLYHEGWYDHCSQVVSCLNVPILVRHPKTKRYVVNFSPYINEVIRESEFMYKLKMPVPDVGQILIFCRDKMQYSSDVTRQLVERNDRIRSSIPSLFIPLMRTLMLKLENAFEPAFSTLTWTSLQIPEFCDSVNSILENFEIFVKEVKDLMEARICEGLNAIANTSLVYLPDEALSLEDFLKENIRHRRQVVIEIENKSLAIETAVIELINKFLVHIEEPHLQENKYDWLDSERAVRPISSSSKLIGGLEAGFKEIDREVQLTMEMIHNDCIELFAYFNMKLYESFVKSTKSSLEQLKKEASGLNTDQHPVVKTYLELRIPTIVLDPTLDRIETIFKNVIANIMETNLYYSLWGQRREFIYDTDAGKDSNLQIIIPEENYHKMVTENKEIVRVFMSLQGIISLLQPDIKTIISEYLKYSYIWAEDRDDQIEQFCDSRPLTVEIIERFQKYAEEVETLKTIPDYEVVGPIKISLENFKLAVIIESNAWKNILGTKLVERNKQKLNGIVDFIKAQEKIMIKPIRDLDECRVALLCLELIRDRFTEMDMELNLMEETYAVFLKFKIDTPREDIERIDTLRFNFETMNNHAKQVQSNITELQGPLLHELTEGVDNFKIEVEIFDRDFEENGPMVPGLSAREASDRVLILQDRFDELWRKYEMYSSGERLFGLEVNEYPVLWKRKKEFNLLNKLYGLYLAVNHSIDGYNDILWSDVDIEQILTELVDFQNKCRKLPKALKDWPAFLDLKKKIEDFSETCPLLELMTNKAMKERHWKRLSEVCHYNFDVENPSFTLRGVMEAPLLQYRDDVEDICISAVKEKDIEAKLKQVIADWAIADLSFSNFKSRGELLLKGAETGEIIMALEDSSMIMNGLLSNRYNQPFKRDIQLWAQKLVNTSEILEKWLLVQNLWIYLEAVFVGGDIARQLPAEAKRFSNIDKSWVKIMARAHETTNAVECCTGDETMGQILPHLLEQLESCQKSLTGYLESKRLLFPRFFFISDPVLLEILGQSSNPASIQPHLPSLFDAIFWVDFDEKKSDYIVAINSDVGEKVQLEKYVQCSGAVETWLTHLLLSVKETVRAVIAAQALCLNDPEYNFVQGFQQFCGQAGLLGLQLLWTSNAELALKKCKIDRMIMKNTNQNFLDLLNALIDLTSKNLTKMERIRFETMVTIHVHQRDIFDNMVKLKIRYITDFEWQKQSRFYFNEDSDEVTVGITDVIFIYQDEYLGITERLAITPLTDRCYITLAQAIWINMGGAPAGPAGTGKTETVKDMGRALGKFVVVFNCSDQMDFKGLGRIFKGLAQSGTWGCFDEFNRIELPVLSVAAQQIYIVLQARKERKAVFIFMDGDNVSMNIEFGIFLTMNPGYAGRQELPENLKIMFRTVAMMVPDRQIIIRVKLASCGFRDNITLSGKFFTLYQLCEEQLSKQVHYDFGLRNILSVLRTLGAQRRSNPYDTEETIVMRVLRDMNLSKLVDEDEALFLSLIDDTFPGIKLTTFSWKDLQKALTKNIASMRLVNHPGWNLKIIQLYETSLVRHGLMVLGPTGAGKTKCMLCLMRAMTDMGQPHKEMRMNPKAITAPQMFGRLDVATNDWTDGIFSTLWRRSLKLKKTDFCWLVLDGPVDAVWIENLNSVLDDNKTLTLANGDRIVMAANCKLVFEPDNVDNASPATVSRMGMVFMSASVLPWSPILEAWLKNRSNQEAAVLKNLFNSIYADLQLFVLIKLKPKMFLREAMYIKQCCDVLQGILDVEEENRSWTDKQLERLFLFALMWSLGALLELEDRIKMELFVTTHPSNLDWPKCGDNETIFEFLVNTDTGRWQHWSERVEPFIYPSDSILEFTSILVPNVDNVRTNFLISTIAKQRKSVLLIGEQGTAKTVMIKGYMSTFNVDYALSKSFNFSSATTPNMVQRIIESYVDKRVGTTYGPPAGKTLSIFIDDINMPVINDWGDQITNEIVRQLMECGGFYSLDKPGDFSTIVDVLFLSAMIHPGGGRNDIPHRLKRQFCIFNCTLPSVASMDLIFQKIACGYFCPERFDQNVVDLVEMLVPLTRTIWQQTKTKMLPTPAKFHYVFNLRDLSRIWQGMLNVKSGECENTDQLLKLWKHECNRVISDRFIDSTDKKWFSENMITNATSALAGVVSSIPEEDTFWADFLRDPPETTGDEPDDYVIVIPKVYEEIPSREFVKDRLYMFMELYNESIRGASMDLVFFDDAMINLLTISRIIRTSRGNALLVGVGGSGKQSLTRLASFIALYKSFQLQLTRSYNIGNLMEDLKYLYRVAGLDGQGISFIFTDNDIKDETFLESMNNILSSGEIANLFPKDEIDEIQSELIPILKKIQPKTPPTVENLYEFFITRAVSNLHVVLCFSPVGEKFRSRALKFPGLISGCTINWFSRWPKAALIEVSSHFLKDFPMVAVPEVKENLVIAMGEIQDGVAEICNSYFQRFRRRVFVTPKTYTSFLNTYKIFYQEKFDEINTLADRVKIGLTKLVEAQENVDELKEELKLKEVEVNVATEAADKVLNEVLAASQIANKIKEDAAVVKDKAETLVIAISADQEEAEQKLLMAKPALEAAEAALLTIKAADIATVRKLGKPPYLITLIMDVVLIYFKKRLDPVKPDNERRFLQASWNESLRVMADTRFLSKLQEYPKDTINAEIVDLVVPYLENELYTYENAKTACGNVAGLVSWTIAMASFYEVNKEVLPLKTNLAIQQAKLSIAQAELDSAMELLASKESEVRQCQTLYEEAMAHKQIVFDDAMKVKNKMDAATALISGLSGERIRWTDQLAHFKAETERLVGDIVLLVGFLGYSGPFNQEFRSLMQASWLDMLIGKKIPVTSTLSVIESLTDNATIGEWNLEGLPNDELSIQNGIIVTKASRYPLLIDPQNQGKIWIKNKEQKNQLVVTTLGHKYFRNHLEDSISIGYPIIIEDIAEELDPVLDHVLEKNYIKIGTTFKVKVGDKEVDVHKDFRLYITTKLANPSYTPEIFARTSMIDFTVTIKGLEDQLLGRVIMTEKKELETEKTNLIIEVTANRRKMRELEQNLLYKLTTIQGSLLDDVSVIEVLNTTKNTAAEVKEQLAVARTTEIKINAAREEFRPVATRGSVLYFIVVSMAMVNYMYQTSLVQFLERFDISLARSDKSPVTSKRILHINDYLTYEIFKYKSRGLYEQHKYMFVLLLVLKIDLERIHITMEEFQNFIKGGAALDLKACPDKPARWITDLTWLNIVQLSSLRQFQYILQQSMVS
ncbi:dynein axonemal heavy chain 8-like isoform X2 [Harmonia axyridis]|uniref:dynein axonemal heavy chain 8-like isoform X2 n=1 Tax=Harmonia axyridis TaxID=115357 RepID=UPI001E275DC8|nr:dynein axonemal heavy chain 8-like isoform X2 [Harmonia axyridis]